jgi:hypothetical protein
MTWWSKVGCDLKAWAAVHGLASLALDGPLEIQKRAVRDAVLAAMLAFVLTGCVSCAPPTGESVTIDKPQPKRE